MLSQADRDAAILEMGKGSPQAPKESIQPHVEASGTSSVDIKSFISAICENNVFVAPKPVKEAITMEERKRFADITSAGFDKLYRR